MRDNCVWNFNSSMCESIVHAYTDCNLSKIHCGLRLNYEWGQTIIMREPNKQMNFPEWLHFISITEIGIFPIFFFFHSNRPFRLITEEIKLKCTYVWMRFSLSDERSKKCTSIITLHSSNELTELFCVWCLSVSNAFENVKRKKKIKMASFVRVRVCETWKRWILVWDVSDVLVRGNSLFISKQFRIWKLNGRAIWTNEYENCLRICQRQTNE